MKIGPLTVKVPGDHRQDLDYGYCFHCGGMHKFVGLPVPLCSRRRLWYLKGTCVKCGNGMTRVIPSEIGRQRASEQKVAFIHLDEGMVPRVEGQVAIDYLARRRYEDERRETRRQNGDVDSRVYGGGRSPNRRRGERPGGDARTYPASGQVQRKDYLGADQAAGGVSHRALKDARARHV